MPGKKIPPSLSHVAHPKPILEDPASARDKITANLLHPESVAKEMIPHLQRQLETMDHFSMDGHTVTHTKKEASDSTSGKVKRFVLGLTKSEHPGAKGHIASDHTDKHEKKRKKGH